MIQRKERKPVRHVSDCRRLPFGRLGRTRGAIRTALGSWAFLGSLTVGCGATISLAAAPGPSPAPAATFLADSGQNQGRPPAAASAAQPALTSQPAGATARPAAPVQAISLQATRPSQAPAADRKTKYTVTVTGAGWQSTSIPLVAGDKVEFHANGEMTLSDGHTSTPAGVARGWTDLVRLYPLSSANSGALIGRVGAGAAALPFLIGAGDQWTVPASGVLYVRANLSPDLTAQGAYKLQVHLHPARTGSSAQPAASQDFAKQLSPALFAAIPRRVSDAAGDPGDMVNLAMVGTESQMKSALAQAGWFPTDPNTSDALVHGLLETLAHKEYMEVPMSTLYLFGRAQDLAYARANPIEVAATRNHMRLWQTTEKVDGLPLWVGSSTRDHGFEKDQRTGGVTHHIDPDIDRERDFILQSLHDAGTVKAAAYVTPSNPVHSARTATGGTFSSDGRILVLLLN